MKAIRFIGVFLLMVLVFFANGSSKTDAMSSPLDDSVKDSPYMVTFYFICIDKKTGVSKMNLLPAVVLSKYWLLTNNHSLPSNQIIKNGWVIDSTNDVPFKYDLASEHPNRINVESLIEKGAYSSKSNKPDQLTNYILLKLGRPLIFNSNVQPIQFASENLFSGDETQLISTHRFLRTEQSKTLFRSRVFETNYFKKEDFSRQQSINNNITTLIEHMDAGYLEVIGMNSSDSMDEEVAVNSNYGGAAVLNNFDRPVLIGLLSGLNENRYHVQKGAVNIVEQNRSSMQSMYVATTYSNNISDWIKNNTGISGVSKSELDDGKSENEETMVHSYSTIIPMGIAAAIIIFAAVIINKVLLNK